MSIQGPEDASAAEGPALQFPTEGRLLGLDYGTKRVGVAVSTYEQNIASPLETLTRTVDDVDAQTLRTIADEYRVVGIVVGLPVHMSGDEGGSAHRARVFGAWVAKATGLPVTYWDERFTSAIAEAHLLSADLSSRKRKTHRDKLAATFMLQAFLDAEDRTAPPVPTRDG
ncbi:MAG: Holliday junction resolvase RuvX [Planctomycetaceae bacterium]